MYHNHIAQLAILLFYMFFKIWNTDKKFWKYVYCFTILNALAILYHLQYLSRPSLFVCAWQKQQYKGNCIQTCVKSRQFPPAWRSLKMKLNFLPHRCGIHSSECLHIYFLLAEYNSTLLTGYLFIFKFIFLPWLSRASQPTAELIFT